MIVVKLLNEISKAIVELVIRFGLAIKIVCDDIADDIADAIEMKIVDVVELIRGLNE
jgi:hypothetical protein